MLLCSGTKNNARVFTWTCASFCLVACSVLGVLYFGTYHTPWIYDDLDGIRQNPALRAGADLWRIIETSPSDSTPYGRPLVALSLAANYALGGLAPAGYRAVNLALHFGAALWLYDLLRRVMKARTRCEIERAEPVAFWVALLFTVHPLATTVVTYTVQRAEGMMAFFYLATLAITARALAAPERKFWSTLSVVLCACGMAAKETMATAPVAALVMHRACFAGSWREVFSRWRLHLALVSTWAVLAACVITWPRRQSVGMSFDGMGPFDYLNLQTGAWLHYLSLIPAPWRIAIDHWPQPVEAGAALMSGATFAALYIGAVILAWRRSPPVSAGLLLAGLILLPTSTVIPIFTSPVADHRMYLPAAFGLSCAVAGIFVANQRRPWLAHLVLAGCAIALAVGTMRANQVYRSARSVWENAVARGPDNARALNNLGLALADEGRADEGEARINQALSINADYADAWYNLGTLQGRDGRLASAEQSFRRALALRPASASAHCNLAVVLYRRGKKPEAIRHYEEAIQLRPEYPAANFNLAVLLMETGDYASALPRALSCLRGDPDYPKARELAADLKRLTKQ